MVFLRAEILCHIMSYLWNTLLTSQHSELEQSSVLFMMKVVVNLPHFSCSSNNCNLAEAVVATLDFYKSNPSYY